MKQKSHQKKRKKRSRTSKPAGNGPFGGSKKDKEEGWNDGGGKREVEKEKAEKDIIESLMEAFGSVSMVEVTAACKEVGGDPNRGAEILSDMVESADDPLTSSVSSVFSGLETGSTSGYWAGSSTSSSEGFTEKRERGFKGSKQKRVVAATGTVSTVIGKDYMKVNPRKMDVSSMASFKELGKNGNRAANKEEAEQFLSSMLGDDCELSMAVVRDVLCQCGYNVDKALDVLLDISSSSCDGSLNGRCYRDALDYKEDRGFTIRHSDSLADITSDCMSPLSESELQDNFWAIGYRDRNYSRVLISSEDPSPTIQGSKETDLPQKVLESLFNIPQSPKHEPSKMNWRDAVKKMQSLGSGIDVCSSSGAESQQDTCAKGDEYHEFRKAANQHWSSMKSYYQRAAEAYSKGERAHAAYLSDQGRTASKLAQRADERASQDIFIARNKGIENVITIDLHGQHVKQAMRLLKLHLLFGSHVPSVRTLRVITGCGSHGVGKSKLKQSVTNLLEREGVGYCEENRGTLLIKLEGYREFSFLETGSDSE